MYKHRQTNTHTHYTDYLYIHSYMHTYIFTHTYLYTLMYIDFFEISHGIRHVILILKKYYAENIMRTAFAKSQSSITQGGRPEANP